MYALTQNIEPDMGLHHENGIGIAHARNLEGSCAD